MMMGFKCVACFLHHLLYYIFETRLSYGGILNNHIFANFLLECALLK